MGDFIFRPLDTGVTGQYLPRVTGQYHNGDHLSRGSLNFKRKLVPYCHDWLRWLRAGLSNIAMVIMATVIAACSNSDAEAPPPPPPEVDASRVVTKSVRQWDEFTGRIAAIGAVDIRPRVSGYIDRIAFKEGDEVKAGDLLFVVDPRPYRAAYDSAVAQLERVRASAQLAEAQYKRAESLIKNATISFDTYDTRRAALGQASADVHDHRMDRPELPGSHSRQRRPAGVPDLGLACLPSAGRAL